MEKYVVSRELAEKLKEAGYPQDSKWLWLDHGELGWILVERGTVIYTDVTARCTAPMSDELLEQIPHTGHVDAIDGTERLTIVMAAGRPLIYYSDGSGISKRPQPRLREHRKLADSLAELWLWSKASEEA